MAFLTGQLWHVLKSWFIDAFLGRGDFHAPSRFARSTIREEKWGLLVV